MLSYYWPPLGGPGALRPVKFAKYLPDHGIYPTVVTRKDIAYHSRDSSLANDVPGIAVIRTDSLDPARVLYQLGMRDYRVKGWHDHVKRAVNLPDSKTPWAPFAYNAARRIAFDCVFVTAPPFSAFITAYYLAKTADKPLIVDFRDAWLEYPFMPYRGHFQKRLVRHWERKIVHSAKAITVVDDNIKNVLVRKYPEIAARISVIPNGYDPDDFQRVTRPEVFTISYIGTIRDERDPGHVLRAVDAFREESHIPASSIKFRFIGHVEERYLPAIGKYPFVETSGHLPYKEALRAFCNSHLSVLITTGSEYFFPSRQNEYLASGLPVMVCGKSKGLHVLESAFKKGYPGWIHGFGDIQGMKETISAIYRKYKRGAVMTGRTPYTELTRQNLTGVLAELIKQNVRR